jgi:hypothetical protein
VFVARAITFHTALRAVVIGQTVQRRRLGPEFSGLCAVR